MKLVCNYIQAELKDGWLDNIDWMAVKERETDAKETKAGNDDDDDDDDDLNRAVNVVQTYRHMVALMKAGESVLKGQY